MKHIIIPASTTSEWDEVTHFAFDPQRVNEIVNSFKDLPPHLDGAFFYSDEGEFVIIDDPDSNYAYVGEIPPDHRLPEQNIRFGMVKYYKGTESIVFCAYGKHTNEEFYATTTDDELLNLIKQA